jgi:uncharacterized membrane protein
MSSLLVLSFMLASAFFWSCFDVARKKLTARLSVPLVFWILMAGQIPLYSALWIFPEQRVFEPEYLRWGLLGLFVNFSANALFILSVSLSSFIRSLPMLSFAPAFSVIFSWIFLGEELSALQLTGVAAIIGGALWLNGLPSLQGDRRGPFYMQIAAICWGLMSVIDKQCLQSASIASHAVFQVLGLFLMSSLWCYRAGVFGELKERKGFLPDWLLGVGSSVLAVLLQLYVLRFVAVSVMESTKRGLNLLWTVVFAYFLFNEQLSVKKLGSLLLMSLGLYLLLR